MKGIKRLPLYSLLILAVILITACGRKTAPVPPQAAIPAAIEDLSYQFSGKEGVILEWTYPENSINGEKLGKIRRFMLYKSDLAGKDYCPDCPATVTSVKKIEPQSVRLGQKMKIRDTHLTPGHHYSYYVISHCGWNIASQESNRISFWYDTPPAAPSSIRTKDTEQGVKLSWKQVEKDIDGEPLEHTIKYQIFRRGETGKFRLLGETSDRTSYYDETGGDEKHDYRLRALNLYKGAAIAGPYSSTVSFSPVDHTPPPVPEIISVIKSGQGPRLLWERVPAPDLAGYRVYRRQGDSGEWKLVVETGPNAFSFKDESLPGGKGPWYYTVTSFDQASPANESSYSQEVAYKTGE